MWCVVVCDLETSRMRRPWPKLATAPQKYNFCVAVYYFSIAHSLEMANHDQTRIALELYF